MILNQYSTTLTINAIKISNWDVVLIDINYVKQIKKNLKHILIKCVSQTRLLPLE